MGEIIRIQTDTWVFLKDIKRCIADMTMQNDRGQYDIAIRKDRQLFKDYINEGRETA